MNCCQCQGIETLFNEQYVVKELARYREKGPHKTTRILIDALKAESVQGMTLLDIGGGVGTIQHELLQSGLSRTLTVEASAAYIEAAREEAVRQGHADRMGYQHGNFVELAATIAPADIVTLDRVICCYHDMPRLVGLSAARTRHLYAMVYPRDTWWLKIALSIENVFYRLRRIPFRVFVHPTQEVEAVVSRQGLKRRFYRQTLIWQVIVYTR
jgi:Methyltransferase domain